MKFNELPIHPSILKNCQRMGYTTPTKIQQKAIPPVLEGRDLLGLAQTGTADSRPADETAAERQAGDQGAGADPDPRAGDPDCG